MMEVIMENLISVIVPVYNVASWLPRCLDSILAQTYKNLEIVIVDDGSLDHSGCIADEYEKTYPEKICVIHTENKGVTAARLRGVREASGSWIGFVDADDEIESDMYAVLWDYAIQYQADISHCGYQMCFSDGRVHYFYNTGILAQQERTEALQELLSGERIEPGLWNKLFHKNLFHSLLYDELVPLDITINEDLLMNYWLFSAAERTVFKDWCPYHYIVRNDSASRVKMNYHKIYDPIRVKEIICKNSSAALHDTAQKAYLNTYVNTYHALLTDGAEYEKDLYHIRKQLEKESNNLLLLGKKRRIMAEMIVHIPKFYRLIYIVYSRFFQKKIYT